MEGNISDILKHCNKWHSLGVKTYICKVEKVFGIRKLYKDSIEFSPEFIEFPEKIPTGYNFLGVSLRESGLMCLDIEGTPGSLSDFLAILEEKSIKIDDFLVETTLNSGIHMYFKAPPKKVNRNVYAIKYNRINFDILFNGKSFSVPSQYGGKSYKFINKSIFDVNSLEDIQEFPASLNFLLKIRDK
ncbi:MAG: hypothetical protein EBS19_07615 [Spirochaetia bacterium]|nr:hypothetical protein [Spirochaetia bacterium]